jgi:hypothetical protein
MTSNYYMTPEEFMYALSDAIRQAYYPEAKWTTKAHPEDIAYTAISLLEGTAAFLGTMIRNEFANNASRKEGLDRLLETIKSMRDSEIIHTEFNDAYVELEDEE